MGILILGGKGAVIAPPTPDPIEPDPLYSLGVDDYTRRWEASRLTGAADSEVTSWSDTKGGAPLILNSSVAAPRLRNPGGGAFIERPAAATRARLERIEATFPDVSTVAYLLRAAGGAVQNNGLEAGGYRMGRAGNGSWQVVGASGSYASGAVPLDTWVVVFAVLDKLTATNTRSKVNKSSLTGPGGITAAGSSTSEVIEFAATNIAAGSLQLASHVVWSRALSNAEMDAVYDAIVAGSPLL